MTEIYCKYCYKHWKLKREYDRHLTCCEFFHNLRKNPQMETYNGKMPTMFELLKLVENLSAKVEKQEKEIARLKNNVGAKQKRAILDVLNNPAHLPLCSFEEWWRSVSINETHLLRVFKYDLTEGIKYALETHIASGGKKILPVRAFTQKPNTFYICGHDNDKLFQWKTLLNADLEKMVVYLSQLFLREFLEWKAKNMTCDFEQEEDEDKKAKELMYMIKINGMKMTTEKRVDAVKKWMFPYIEENIQQMELEFV